jgi:uncharacterized protein YhdP
LEHHLAPELALTAALQQDWARVEHCATVGFKHFQASWTSLHPCAYAARRLVLRNIQVNKPYLLEEVIF